jgi:pyruvate,orthophosphate dikinase
MMVFGNFGENSATGVGFTRNPATGEKELYGEFLYNAQGEDVVAGIRTPSPIEDLKKNMSEAYDELEEITTRLEKHYQDVQDFEFTIQERKLYMLQTRSGKRTGWAAVRIAVDMVNEGLINKGVVFTADEAVSWKEAGKRVVLVREETSPDDIHGMSASQGILTATGGMTSHAAIVGRQMGKPSVVGCAAIMPNEEDRYFQVGDQKVNEGEWISIDGSSGEVLHGEIPTKPSEVLQVIRGELAPEESVTFQYFDKFLSWADEVRKLRVRANADTPQDARIAFSFGAEGIGLARTEHMFFERERLPFIKQMIMAETEEERRENLKHILPFQKTDFYELFKELKGYPVTIRTLDPPLHEFLPKKEELMVELVELKASGSPDNERIQELEKVLERVKALSEFNPMLGHRGCRLGITFPEIIEMQAQAIFEAACELASEGGKVFPEIMVPLIGGIGRPERDHRQDR